MAFTDDVYALVVDDDEDVAETAALTIDNGTDHVSAEYVTSGDEALEYLESETVHTVVSDYRMPGMDGLELLDEVNSEYDVPFIMYTGEGSEDLAVQALRNGAEDYVRKGNPQGFDVLSNRVENAAIKKKADDELSVFKEGAENSGHAIQVTDDEENIVYVNTAFEEESGYDAEELIGETPSILSSGEHDDEFYDEMWNTLTSGEVWEGELLNEDKDGERYWIDQTISPITDESGDLEYLIAINTDITDKKRDSQRKEVLNSMLRHDVANNQNAIMGYLHLLQSTELNDEQQEYVETISNSVEKNNDLLHGIRDLLEKDPQDAETEEEDIEDVVDDALERQESIARSKEVEVETDIGGHYHVSGGPLLSQAVSNLVENALVHPENVEKVEVGAEEAGDQLELFVADDGEGLPEDFSWEKGVKGEDSDGTGVGTWLVKEIAEAYGEGVEAGESEYGGAKFSMKLDKVG